MVRFPRLDPIYVSAVSFYDIVRRFVTALEADCSDSVIYSVNNLMTINWEIYQSVLKLSALHAHDAHFVMVK